MPRQRRIHVSGGLYHAVLRGNHRQAIFDGSDDYLCFEDIVARALEHYGASLFAYCWMTNHVHLAIRIADAPLGSVMRIVASRYARAKQRAVATTGHLFERRYRARLVDAARAAYRCLMGAAPAAGEREALSPIAQSGRATGAARDMVTIPSLDMQGRQSPRSLEAIAAEVAHALDVTMDELRSKRRRPDLVQARGVVAQRALLEGVANMSQVARYLNRAPSTISDLLHGRR